MSREESKIFRKSSMDRISSPEQLNEYIRVVSPSVWIFLGAVVLLLIGVVVWGVFGTVDSKTEAGAVCENGVAVCWLSAERSEKITEGMKVEIGGYKGTVTSVSEAVKAGNGLDAYAMYLGGFSEGDFCRSVSVEISGLSDGVYSARITTDSVSPISFIIH